MSSGRPPTDEVARIAAAYERRDLKVDPDRYSPIRPGNRIAVEQYEEALAEGLSRHLKRPIAELDVLEVGCGSGGGLVRLVSLGVEPSRLQGVDLRPDAIDAAKKLVPLSTLAVADASRLPYRDRSFDLIYQATAFSSMLSPTMRAQVAAEMQRVARPGGLIVSYDFAWNPRNRDTAGITVRELRRIFPGMPMEVRRVTLIPPLARWLGDRSVRLTRVLAKVPLLRSHRLAFIDVPD